MANADKTVGRVDKARSSERLERVRHSGGGAPGEVSVDYGSGSEYYGSGTPAMPHFDFTGRDLDLNYLSIVAPVDELLDDLAVNDHDKV